MEHLYFVTLINRVTGTKRLYRVQGKCGRDTLIDAFRQLRDEMDQGLMKNERFCDYYLDSVRIARTGEPSRVTYTR